MPRFHQPLPQKTTKLQGLGILTLALVFFGGGSSFLTSSSLGPPAGSSNSETPNSTRPQACRIGTPPWSHFSPSKWQKLVKEFDAIYQRRPEQTTNDGGGGFFHYFALYVVIQLIQPTAIVESGAFQGIGTWFLRQMAGDSVKLVILSPEMPGKYVDTIKSIYLTESKFIDFGSTTKSQWHEWVPDIAKTLLFLDDHQAGVRRIQEARTLGFRHVVLDDNYPPGEGDNFSLKKTCGGSTTWDHFGIPDSQRVWLDNFGKVRNLLTKYELETLEAKLHETVVRYAEVPPVWAGPTRFKVDATKYWQVTEPALFEKHQLQNMGIFSQTNIESSTWNHEVSKYTNICYAQLTN